MIIWDISSIKELYDFLGSFIFSMIRIWLKFKFQISGYIPSYLGPIQIFKSNGHMELFSIQFIWLSLPRHGFVPLESD